MSAVQTVLVRAGGTTSIFVRETSEASLVNPPAVMPTASQTPLAVESPQNLAPVDEAAFYEDVEFLEDDAIDAEGEEPGTSGNGAKLGLAALAGVAVLMAVT